MMAYVDWEIRAREFGNCICNYGCPCQFNALPTHGHCHGYGAFHIDTGHFGETRLDGLNAIALYYWPGPIHEGNGTMQLIIDERATEAQREALLKILNGEETEPGATVFNVFPMTMSTTHDPIFVPIDFEVDIEARTAKVSVEGMIEGTGEPIRNPVTGEEHRVRIDLDTGFEYSVAEMGSGSSKVSGLIPMEFNDSYGQFNELNLNPYGIIQ